MQKTNPAIIINNVSKHFQLACEHFNQEQVKDGYFIALDNVSLIINSGECAIIAGANGSGKSLLMLIIAGLEVATTGIVDVSERIGLVFQDADSQILGETPKEDISFGLLNIKTPKNEIENIVAESLKKTGLEKKGDYPARFLSGGEKRRLSVASILAMNAQIIIFDEPYANLDYNGVVQVNNLISDLKKDGKTVIVLTHELEKCLALSDHFIVLNKGQKVFDGTVKDGLTQKLSNWGIHNPIKSYQKQEDLIWQ